MTGKGSIITCESTAPREGGSHPISLLGRNVTAALLVLWEVSKVQVPCGDSSRLPIGLLPGHLARDDDESVTWGLTPSSVCAVTSYTLSPTRLSDQKQPGASGAVPELRLPVLSKNQDFASSRKKKKIKLASKFRLGSSTLGVFFLICMHTLYASIYNAWCLKLTVQSLTDQTYSTAPP